MSSKLFSFNLMVHINHNILVLLYFPKYGFHCPMSTLLQVCKPTIEALPEWSLSTKKGIQCLIY